MTTHQLPYDARQLPVTVLGLGPMGLALATAFLDHGHPTTVWNRTAAKADSLVPRGARIAATAAEAVAASPLTVVCVLDYAAVRSIIAPAADALKGRAVVNLTADSPDQARAMAAWAAGQGIDYLDGAIVTPTTTIGGPGAAVLYSGPQTVFAAHRPTLSSIGGTSLHLGTDAGRAASYEVALLDIFWTTMSGVTHALALARAEGVELRELAPLVRSGMQALPDIAAGYAERIAAGEHPGDRSSILSAAAGMEHVIHAARVHGLNTQVLGSAWDITRRAVDAGHGDEGFSRMADLLTAEPGATAEPEQDPA
ncbi:MULTISPECIES: NAD(P)-dependent oxidoreductase [unclassified Streptomyces]|uniref:NAD(P)-dependent oxidoreductase n=1 Tax=unclassified Streptomyces TaxID=2593676 RepID=UPI0038191078